MRIPILALSGVIVFSVGLVAQSGQDVAPPGQVEPPSSDRHRPDRPPVPYVVKDINPNGDSEAGGFIRFRGETYFYANDGAHGFELWKTDGTAQGTALVKDINTGELHSAPVEMTPFRGRLYFAATSAQTGRELWATDGTTAGTTLAEDINPGPAHGNPTSFLAAGRSLFFRGDNAAGTELWITGGWPGSTRLITDLHPGAESSIPTYPTLFRGEVYFSADDAFTPDIGEFDRELWKTDGTEAGTVRVKDINPGPGTAIPSEMTRLGRYLVFKAQEPMFGPELWRTDGTEEGTTLLVDTTPGPAPGFPSNLVRVGREIFFIGDDGLSGRELWKTDGTPEGSVRVKDINPAGDSSPVGVAFRRGFLFTADHVDYGNELWFSDGTEAGTRLVKDINPGPALSTPLDFTIVDDEAWFVCIRQSGVDDGSVLTELWRTDGTEDGTQRVWQAPGRFSGYAITGLARSGNHLFFNAPTAEDANGISTDFELYAIRLRRGHEWSERDLTESDTTSETAPESPSESPSASQPPSGSR